MVSTLAGRRQAPFQAKDGIGSDAVFVELRSIAVDLNGYVYVNDQGVLRKISPDGLVATLTGGTDRKWFTDENSNWTSGFDLSHRIAVDANGNLYVEDYRANFKPANTVIWVLMASGETVPLRRGEFALSGDAKGNIYIGAQDKGVYWRVTPAGFEQIVSCNAAVPGMFTVDEHRNVYVSNQGLRPAIRKISPEGEVAILAGGVRDPQEPRNVHNYADSVNGVGEEAQFSYPGGVAADAEGNVYLADSGNNAVRKITPNGTVTTLAGKPGADGCVDGRGDVARFGDPRDLCIDRNGTIYVADGRIIRKITWSGVRRGTSP